MANAIDQLLPFFSTFAYGSSRLKFKNKYAYCNMRSHLFR